jgi:hypothetical protein
LFGLLPLVLLFGYMLFFVATDKRKHHQPSLHA